MPYRPREYVPQVYQPNDSRIYDLMMQQNLLAANRAQQQGYGRALMWQGIGNAVQGTLASLAQYKREEPQRKEEERKRKEADKLRGLDQLAGGYVDPVTGEHRGMTELERGKLFRQEGFADKGQDIIDREKQRQLTDETLAFQQRERGRQELGDIANKLDSLKNKPNAAELYAAALPTLRQYAPKDTKLPDTYNQPEIEGLIESFSRGQDVLLRNQIAHAAAVAMEDKNISLQRRVDLGKTIVHELVETANTKPEWDAMLANIDARISDLPEADRERVIASIGVPRQFSPEAHADAVLRTSQTPASAFAMAYRGFVQKTGHIPLTPRDNQAVIIASQGGFGAGARGQQVDPLQLAKARNEAVKELNEETKYIEEHFDGEQQRKMLAQAADGYDKKMKALELGGVGGYGGAGGGAGGTGGGGYGGGYGLLGDDWGTVGGGPTGGGTTGGGEVTKIGPAMIQQRGNEFVLAIPGYPDSAGFPTRQAAENYMLTMGARERGGGAATAAEPDYSQRPDMLGSGGAEPDYSQRPDVLMGDLAGPPPPKPVTRSNLARLKDRFTPRGDIELSPPPPAPNTWTQAVAQLQQGPPPPNLAGTAGPIAPPPGGPAGPEMPMVRREPSREANIPVTNGEVTGFASERDVPMLAREGWRPVKGAAPQAQQSVGPPGPDVMLHPPAVPVPAAPAPAPAAPPIEAIAPPYEGEQNIPPRMAPQPPNPNAPIVPIAQPYVRPPGAMTAGDQMAAIQAMPPRGSLAGTAGPIAPPQPRTQADMLRDDRTARRTDISLDRSAPPVVPANVPPPLAPTGPPPETRGLLDQVREGMGARKSDISLSPPALETQSLAGTAGPMRVPGMNPAGVPAPVTSPTRPGAKAPTMKASPATHPLLIPPDRVDPMTGLTPRQKIEQMQPKVTEATPMAERLNMLETMMSMAGYDMVPIEKRRTRKLQEQKKAQGYSTKSGAPGDESPHQPGQAADYIFAPNGRRISQDAKGLPWELYGLAAKKLGLRWGGEFDDFWDPAHVELPELIGPIPENERRNFRPPLPYFPENQPQ